ncbi:MAG: hypothetical protein JW827_05420 [Spirochaetes bacterium]|nr:hypothetical protein [Spirochaetota bacterium]
MKKYRKLFIIVLVIIGVALFNVSRAVEKWSVLTVEKGLPHRFVKYVTSDGDLIWIATANGVAVFDTSKDKIIDVLSTKKGLLDNFITSVAVDQDLVWIGTSQGLNVYNKKTKEIKNYTKKSGLSDDFITDIVISANYVWAATKFWGVNQYDKATRTWKNFSVLQGLADNSINCLALDGTLVWAGTANGLSFYDEFSGLWISYDITQGLPHPNVRALAVDGQYIWCGTTGGGLARFDKFDESFRIFTTQEGLADDFIQSLKLDGIFLWIGTFSGVTRYDKDKNKWVTYTINDGLSENSVSAIELDGNYIWFGTDGGGATRFDKELPEAQLSPLSYYEKPGKIIIKGSAFDYQGIGSFRISFKNEGMKEWISAGITLSPLKNIKDQKLAEWNVGNLLNLSYDIKLEVIDKEGKKNESLMPFVIDTKPPSLTLQTVPESVKESPVFIKGSYIDENLSRIVVQPDNLPAEVNRMTRSYSAEIPLKKGMNNLEIIAYDIADQKTSLKAPILYDTDIPQIVLDRYEEKTGKTEIQLSGTIIDSSLKRLVLNPGNVEISFESSQPGEYKFTYKIPLSAGLNKFEISAYDFVGNKSSVNPVIEYTSTLPVISLDKSTSKVQSSDFIIKGKYIDDNVDYITIEPPNQQAKIDRNRQTFTLPVQLAEGENVFTATIVDKDNNKSLDFLSVVFSTEKTFIKLVDLPPYTSDKKVKITGEYNEPNLKRIVLQPGEIEAMIDFDKKLFIAQTPELQYGKNNFKVEMYDQFGNKKSLDFSIVFDDKSPIMTLEDLPKVVNTPKITIKGTYIEDHMNKIVLEPGGITSELNDREKSFRAIYELRTGDNKIKIISYDKAQNRSEITKTINLVPQITTSIEETEGAYDSEYVKKLKDEIRRLKDLLKKGGIIVSPRKVSVAIPPESAFYFVPYYPQEGHSMMEISRKYLGSPLFIDFISRLNRTDEIQKRKKILLPSRKLLKLYNQISDKKYKNVMDIIGLSYNLSKGNVNQFRKNLYYFLVKKRFLPLSSMKFYNTRNWINLGDYVISLSSSVKNNSYKKAILLHFHPSRLSVKVLSGKLISYETK